MFRWGPVSAMPPPAISQSEHPLAEPPATAESTHRATMPKVYLESESHPAHPAAAPDGSASALALARPPSTYTLFHTW